MVLTSTAPLAGITDRYASYLHRCRPYIDRLDTGFGLGGIALYFLYKYRWQGKQKDLHSAQDLFSQMLEETPAIGTRNTFLIEMSELACFARQYSAELGMRSEADSYLGLIDEILVGRNFSINCIEGGWLAVVGNWGKVTFSFGFVKKSYF